MAKQTLADLLIKKDNKQGNKQGNKSDKSDSSGGRHYPNTKMGNQTRRASEGLTDKAKDHIAQSTNSHIADTSKPLRGVAHRVDPEQYRHSEGLHQQSKNTREQAKSPKPQKTLADALLNKKDGLWRQQKDPVKRTEMKSEQGHKQGQQMLQRQQQHNRQQQTKQQDNTMRPTM